MTLLILAKTVNCKTIFKWTISTFGWLENKPFFSSESRSSAPLIILSQNCYLRILFLNRNLKCFLHKTSFVYYKKVTMTDMLSTEIIIRTIMIWTYYKKIMSDILSTDIILTCNQNYERFGYHKIFYIPISYYIK